MVPAMVPVWGVVLVLAGAALVCAAAVAPRQIWIWAAHILAGAALLTLAVSALESANPAGIPPFAIFGLGIGLAPYLAGRRLGRGFNGWTSCRSCWGWPRRTGALMLLAQAVRLLHLRSAPPIPDGAWRGVPRRRGCAPGRAHSPCCSRWLQQLAHLGLSVVLFAFFFGCHCPAETGLAAPTTAASRRWPCCCPGWPRG